MARFLRRFFRLVFGWVDAGKKDPVENGVAESCPEGDVAVSSLKRVEDGAWGPDRDRHCRGISNPTCLDEEIPHQAETSMRRPSRSVTHREKTFRDKPAKGDWRIGVGDVQSFTRESSTGHRTIDRGEDEESGLSCTTTATNWLDTFRNRYQSWTSQCRGSVSEILSIAAPESNSIARPNSQQRRRSSSSTKPKTFTTTSRDRPASSSFAGSIGRCLSSPKKVIYFVRHGTAYCNVCRYTNWMEDQRLTPRGWAQAAALRDHIAVISAPEVRTEFIEGSRSTRGTGGVHIDAFESDGDDSRRLWRAAICRYASDRRLDSHGWPVDGP